MYQLLILLPINIDINYFDENWPSFLKEAEQMPGLMNESITHIERCLYGHNTIRRIYSFQFKDQSSLENALTSPAGEKAGNILHQITGGNLILLSGEFKEDSLYNIQSISTSKKESL